MSDLSLFLIIPQSEVNKCYLLGIKLQISLICQVMFNGKYLRRGYTNHLIPHCLLICSCNEHELFHRELYMSHLRLPATHPSPTQVMHVSSYNSSANGLPDH
jgi:hypothetical protein